MGPLWIDEVDARARIARADAPTFAKEVARDLTVDGLAVLRGAHARGLCEQVIREYADYAAANRDYVTGTQSNFTNYTQDAGGVQLQGEPFSTWAGKVSLGGGVEYRKEQIAGDSDSLSKVVWLNGTTRTLGAWQYGNPQPINGSVTVNEWFAETVERGRQRSIEKPAQRQRVEPHRPH